jgi:preprotein translocase subunit SecE
VGTACKRLLGPRRVTKLNYMLIVLAFIVPVLLLTYLLDLLVKWVNLTPK